MNQRVQPHNYGPLKNLISAHSIHVLTKKDLRFLAVNHSSGSTSVSFVMRILIIFVGFLYPPGGRKTTNH